MSSRRRSELKNYFIKGRIPKEEDFQDLIDSTLNILDDDVQVNEEDGLILSPKENNSLLTFKEKTQEEGAFWRIELESDANNEQFLKFKFSQNEHAILSLAQDGKVGVGIEKPLHNLDVNGAIGSHGRIHYYRFGEVPADGQWHNIVENISDYSAFEVTAACGEKGAHAITHAIAVGTYGKSKGGINQTQNFFGRSRNRIELRWNGDYFNYALQIRSIRPYAKETNVKYHVGLLWE
jgi:hypothetical protein